MPLLSVSANHFRDSGLGSESQGWEQPEGECRKLKSSSSACHVTRLVLVVASNERRSPREREREREKEGAI